MKKIIYFFLLSVVSHMMCAAPQLPDTCGVGMPSILSKRFIKESEVNGFLNSENWGQSSRLSKYWTVYSDRSQNITYSFPSNQGEICDTLTFNEQVRIAQIENDYALVYTEKQKGITFPLISTSAKCRGWIPMKNLLLWSSCPTDEAGIHNKTYSLVFMNLPN